jgi:hypothetical protein
MHLLGARIANAIIGFLTHNAPSLSFERPTILAIRAVMKTNWNIGLIMSLEISFID